MRRLVLIASHVFLYSLFADATVTEYPPRNYQVTRDRSVTTFQQYGEFGIHYSHSEGIFRSDWSQCVRHLIARMLVYGGQGNLRLGDTIKYRVSADFLFADRSIDIPYVYSFTATDALDREYTGWVEAQLYFYPGRGDRAFFSCHTLTWRERYHCSENLMKVWDPDGNLVLNYKYRFVRRD